MLMLRRQEMGMEWKVIFEDDGGGVVCKNVSI